MKFTVRVADLMVFTKDRTRSSVVILVTVSNTSKNSGLLIEEIILSYTLVSDFLSEYEEKVFAVVEVWDIKNDKLSLHSVSSIFAISALASSKIVVVGSNS